MIHIRQALDEDYGSIIEIARTLHPQLFNWGMKKERQFLVLVQGQQDSGCHVAWSLVQPHSMSFENSSWSLGRGLNPRPAAFLACGYKAAAPQYPLIEGHLPG